jgi:hypothetical protein
MQEVCPVCHTSNCGPKATNALGIEVQEYTHATGWVSASEPYATNCLARQAMQAMPRVKAGMSRRTYEALAPRT